MAVRTGSTNSVLQSLIQELKTVSSTQKSGLWKRIAEDLEKPTRQRRIVNISSINRFTKPNEIIIVPGKVLGYGSLNHSLTVAAFSFSESAREIIEQAKGKCLTIKELVQKNPKAKDVKIIG